jgi:hypothetical protein
MAELTAERLRALFHYNSENGHFTRRQRTATRTKLNERAGSTTPRGYRMLKIDRRSYQEHRLAWLYVYGQWPQGELDHADNDRSNNAIANIRPASRKENCFNQGKRQHNTSGYKGVSWHAGIRKWRARIAVESGRRHLGFFASVEDAARAYELAALKFHGEFAKT